MSVFEPLEKTLPNTFYDVWNVVAAWSRKTFGTDQERGPVGPLTHMKKELEKELLPPDGDPYKLDEYADILILLCDAARRAGFQHYQLIDAGIAKMEINKARKWAKPTGDAISEHIKE